MWQTFSMVMVHGDLQIVIYSFRTTIYISEIALTIPKIRDALVALSFELMTRPAMLKIYRLLSQIKVTYLVKGLVWFGHLGKKTGVIWRENISISYLTYTI